MKRNTIILIAIGIILLLLGLNWAKIITITAEQTYFAGAVLAIVGLVMAWQHLKNSAEETSINNMPLYNMDEIQNTCLKQFEPGGTNKILSKEYHEHKVSFKSSATFPLFVQGRLAYYVMLYNVTSNEKALTAVRKLSDREIRSVDNPSGARYVIVSNEFGISSPMDAKEAFHNMKIMLEAHISPETDIDFRRYWTSNNQSGGQFGGGMPNQQNRPPLVPPRESYASPQQSSGAQENKE